MRSLRFTLALAIILSGQFLFSAAPPPPPGGAPPCWPPPCVPIDGGITMLMAAGAAYGAKKLYNSRKKNSNKL